MIFLCHHIFLLFMFGGDDMNSIEEDIKNTISFINGKTIKGYGRIYSSSNEDILDLYADIDFKNKNVLSVLASGDQAFMAYLKGATSVDLFDVNKLTLYYYYLRIWTMKYFHTFYAEPYLCKLFIEKLISKVRAESDIEFSCFEYWRIFLKQLEDHDLRKLFFSLSTIIQLSDEELKRLCNSLKKKKSTFYNVDISSEINIQKKYDIIITSNIPDWIYSSDESLKKYKENIDRLLNPKGIVLSSNLSISEPNPNEKKYFDENFDFYELETKSNSCFGDSPGYMFVKRNDLK